MTYEIIMHTEAWQAVALYFNRLRKNGIIGVGRYLGAALQDCDLKNLSNEQGFFHLLNTKKPRIYAESEVRGDGSDWTLNELSLLGDIAIATPVTVFDDGSHDAPRVHEKPFEATLLFVAGALLRNDLGEQPADLAKVVRDGKVQEILFFKLYENRLLPSLIYANDKVAHAGKMAIVTIPGIGCGQFAGPFRGTMGIHLQTAIVEILKRHAARLNNIRLVHFDPFNESSDATLIFGQIEMRTRPLCLSAHPKGQLLLPLDYQERDEDFSNCELFSVVAWDHVSWPGNDYYVGFRSTDDGVKAAATSAMNSMTGLTGRYDEKSHRYLPPSGYKNWESVVDRNGLQISTTGNINLTDSFTAK